MTKNFLVLLLSTMAIATGASETAFASKGLSPGNQIVRDYSQASGFRQWVETLTKNAVPGDFQYLQQTFKVYPNLVRSDSLPKLNFEKNTFEIREGLSQVTLQYYPGKPYEYAINGQKIELSRFDLPSQKMTKILALMKKSGQASHFLLLPVAWAQDSNMPTKTSLTVLAITSAATTMQLPAIAPQLSDLLDKVQETTTWKSFLEKNDHCVQSIHDLEQVLWVRQQLDFHSMECVGSELKVSFAKTDEPNQIKTLIVEKEGFSIEASDKKLSISRFGLSPSGEFSPIGGSSREMMNNYVGAAASVIREFCSSTCANTLKGYWKILQSAEPQAGSGSSSLGTH